MIKIGELSSLSGVSIQTIRFYQSEGLISPVFVDRWTNYRYYDETSVVRLSEINYLKNLGFSLKEIKNLSEIVIKEKIAQLKIDMATIKSNINKLSAIRKKEGGFIMKNFVNDENVIGKWKKIGVVKNKEDFNKSNFVDADIFNFENLYFLPNGENYWVFSWTKSTLFLKDRQMPYEIIDGKLFVGVVDYQSKEVENYAVYEKVDSKQYTAKEIAIKDNVDIPFIEDKNVIGFWETVDYVEDISSFESNKQYWEGTLFLEKYIFEPKGKLLSYYKGVEEISQLEWSKGVVINKNMSTASEYVIKSINGVDYLFVEWKSGDYIWGGKVYGYYVLKRIK